MPPFGEPEAIHTPGVKECHPCGGRDQVRLRNYVKSSFHTLPILACALALMASPSAWAGDILRGGVSADASRKAAAARASSGAEAAAAARKTAEDRLARTSRVINALRNAKVTASSSPIPNGLIPGGLEVLPTGDPNYRWDNASAPVQSGSTVNIKQTGASAVLHWKTFNVGHGTTVNFDQSAGNGDAGKWIAYNRIFDPGTAPSRVLGSIKAQGQVYVINRNGIIFGAGSQVNARTLVAAALPINDNLIQRGLLNQEQGNVEFLFSGLAADGFDGVASPDYTPYARVGDVVVEHGASLGSPVSAEGYGGRVMLVGKNVRNDGVIATPAGQTILAAGLQVGIDAHSTNDPSLRGLDVFVGAVSDATLGSGGEAKNTGLIESARGSIIMAGKRILQYGGLESSTSVDVNGRVDLLANYGSVVNPAYSPTSPGLGPPFLFKETGLVELGADSVVRILPEWASAKTLATATLPLRSRVNMQGRTVHFSRGSMLLAPNAEVNIDAGNWIFEPSASNPRATFVYSTGQIYLDEDSFIDVSGSTDVFIPMAHHILTLQLRGSELADSPLQRSANLRAVELVLDMRLQGSFYGREWVGTPLGDVTGYLNLIERNVGQLTLEGGDINLHAGGSVVIRKGASLDASGGYARNEGGKIQTTRVQLGRYLIDIADATPDRIYGAIYDGKTTSSSQKWGVSRTYLNALAPLGGYMQKEYIAGTHAGSISISAPSMALDGDMKAARIIGPRQMRNSLVSSSLPLAGRLELRFESQDDDPASTNKFGLLSPTPPRIVFKKGFEMGGAPAFSVDANDSAATLPSGRLAEVALSPDLLDDDRFGQLLIRNGDGDILVSKGTTLRVPVGGGLDFTGANIFVDGDIFAPGGTINFVAYTYSPYLAKFLNPSAGDLLPDPDYSRGIVRLASGATISAAGQIHDDRVTGKIGNTDPIAITGGSVTLEGFTVELQEGSKVDVSGGIAYGANGKYKYGNAGTISVLAGQDPGLPAILGGKLILDGMLAGYSGGHGGSLTLKAPVVQVGGGSTRADALVVQPDFFNHGGFSRFELIGIGAIDPRTGANVPGVLIAPGTVIEPRSTSMVAVPYGPRGMPEFREVQKPVGLRDPVSLTFRATGAVDTFSSVILARGDVVMGEGAVIFADPGAEIELIGETVAVLGTIEAPGGRIAIEGAGEFPVLSPGPVALPTVYIGPNARLSTAGTTVLLPDPYGRRRGYVLPGGTIEISGNILAEAGAVLDVSGAADFLDFTPAELGLIEIPNVPKNSGVNAPLYSLQVRRTRVESNGGSIILDGSEMLLVDSTLIGQPGGPTALGGFLSVSSGRYVPPNTPSTSADINLLVRQNATFIGGGRRGIGIAVVDSAGATVTGMGYFSADKFLAGGFSALKLGGNVRFEGPVSISAESALLIANGGIVEADSRVNLTAPYIRIGQEFPTPLLPDTDVFLFTQTDASGIETEYHPTPTSGSGNLQLNASLIDVGTLVLQSISQAGFFAPGGDIRGNGTFIMAGDLVLEAGQVYPTTAANFDIFVYDNTLTAAPGSVTVRGAGTRPLPLSAGGSLRIMASIIEQGGTLRAPLGTIALGWDGITEQPKNDVVGDAVGALATPVTQRLTLAPGSVTSVSAIDPFTGLGTLIPYGISPDGLQWMDPVGLDITLGGLPAKAVSFGAQTINMAGGSVVDIRGGGDLYAYRWVQGLGGFEDILANENSFAILPGYQFGYAPYAPFNTSASTLEGDPGYVNSTLQVGDQITLRGSAALAAGTYTLLPARYALLPGAVLVTAFDTLDVGSGDPFARYQSTTPGTIALDDGSFLVAGFLSNGLTPGRGLSPTSTTFQVLTQNAIRERSEYEDYYANDFLRRAAADREQVAQRLPVDSGSVQFFAATDLTLQGRVLAAAGSSGRGGSADIAVPGNISITDRGATPSPGSIEINASVLSSWGVESLLIGGSRDGSTLNVRATSITLDNRGSSFSAPEIILASRQTVTLADNSSIASTGVRTQPGTDFNIVGDGALVRVSGDGGAMISRTGFVNSPLVALNIGAGASISGTGITLDSTYDTNLDPTALLDGQNIFLNSGRISVFLDNPGVAAPAFGLVLEGAALNSLAGAGELSLLSYSTLDFYGTGDLPLGNPELLTLRAGGLRGFNQAGGTVTISAGELFLDNTQGAVAPADEQAADGTLLLDLDVLHVGTNTIAIRQFTDLVVNAPGGIYLDGEGGISTPGNFTGTASAITASAAARQTLSAAGDFVLLAVPGTPTYKSGLGATVSISGQSVTLNPDILLPGGLLSASATAGDLNLGGNVDLSGQALEFFDVERFVGGGSLDLASAGGDVAISGAVNVSAPVGGGDAGSVRVSVPDGEFLLTGTLTGTPGTAGNSGSFHLDALDLGAAGDFDTLNSTLDGGSFFETRSFRARSGDVTFSGTAKAHEFLLFADQGDVTLASGSLIDASGQTGGTVRIAAHGDLTVSSGATITVEADDFDSAGKGGSVTLEAGTQRNGVAGTGQLMLAGGSKIDLSVLSKDRDGPGSSAFYGQFTGTLHLRAPQNAGATDLLVAALDGTIEDASSIVVEGFQVTDLSNPVGSQITTAVRSAIQTNGNTFGANVGSITTRLLASNAGLAGILVVTPGAEIINSSGSLTLPSDWNLATFRFGPKSAPGVLTIRAAGDLVFEGALSDAFNGGSSLWASPLMANNPLLPMNAQSWSYRLTAGANTGSANALATAGVGSLKLGKDYGAANVSGGANAYTPDYVATRYQAIRTGSGSIQIAAATDVQLLNPFAVIYTAGTRLASESSVFAPGDFEIPHLVPDAGPTNVADSYVLGKQQQITTAQYSTAGGNIAISAGNDIARLTRNASGLIDDSSRQLPSNWLYRRSYVDETGEYGRSGVKFTSTGSRYVNDPDSSTTWWVDFTNFFEGIGTLGGGNISVSAGRDIRNIDAVAPTSARSPRGAADAALLVELGGGDIAISAGRDISGGVYYVERGSGILEAGRDVTTNQTRSPSLGILGTPFNLNNPVLADSSTWLPTTYFVGKGNFDVTARGDLLAGPVSNVFLLPQGIGNKFWYKTYFQTYGATSGVKFTSVAGDLTFRTEATLSNSISPLPLLNIWTSTQLVYSTQANNVNKASNTHPWLRLSESSTSAFSKVSSIMAPSLSINALSGSVSLAGDITLFPSPVGGLEIVAANEISGLNPTGVSDTLLPGQSSKVWTSSTINVSDASPLSIPGALSPFAFFEVLGLDPLQTPQRDLPTASTFAQSGNSFLDFLDVIFDESGSYTGTFGLNQTKQALHAPGILHAGDPEPVRLYAASGDISGLTLFSPKAAQITAGNDINDIAFYIQNVSEDDVSFVSAGRDIILYNPNTSARQAAVAPGNALAFGDAALPGDIQISGQGSLQVLAGRDLDLGSGAKGGVGAVGQGITSIGNNRNPYLPFAGASLYLGAGLGPSTGLADSELNVEDFLDEYFEKYRDELTDDGSGLDLDSMSDGQRAQVALQVLALVLRDTGRNAAEVGNYETGYAAIETLFGDVGKGGDINTRTRDIRTRSGGEISIFAPGGSLVLEESSSTVAVRPTIQSFAGTDGLMLVSNSGGTSATPSGIVTEYGGGISVVTDGDVDIGVGRIFTLRGGNIVIWSSTGDIAAGAASKTVATAPPTRVLIDPQTATIETDLSGLATGGGIGVLSTVEGVPEGDVDLIAPVGTVDAGDAGIRASGNLNIAATQVLNADNISVGGTSQGVPAAPTVAAPNIAGLSSASSSTGASSSAAENVAQQSQPTAQEEQFVPSIIEVEVLGYGGEDEE